MDVWDSGVSRDDSLGTASLSLDMAAENAIQVSDRRRRAARPDAGAQRRVRRRTVARSCSRALRLCQPAPWESRAAPCCALPPRAITPPLSACALRPPLLKLLPLAPQCRRAQDRWLQLAGAESGELRVRLAVVPGPAEAPAVQQMVALLSSTYATASTSTLQARRTPAPRRAPALLLSDAAFLVVACRRQRRFLRLEAPAHALGVRTSHVAVAAPPR